MQIPQARGPLTEALFGALRSGSDDFYPVLAVGPVEGEDAALALWVLYELHYRGFDDVSDEMEWDPQLLRLRVALERDLEQRLRERFTSPQGLSVVEDFFDWVAEHDGASVADHVQRAADRDQVLELLRVRSIYHLKESDPVAWVVPRLGVRAKAALTELQYDEYGNGDPNRLHHHLYARGLEACGLEAAYGAHLDEVPLEVLEQNNAMSLFGLHRRLRGAALGHLAAFEATSSMPSRRMVQGLERLGLPAEIVEYYAEHVEADAVHEQLAVRAICGALLDEEPELADDVWFGAFTCLDLEDRFARTMLDHWGADRLGAGEDRREEVA
ncbi:iron-containing redox enzyme family protein [Nocardioides sp. T2.26MG-1]|uniref:iron-containing redox enzyme family protein n=1 Tax=Nocardioides sp. T2.26MG-1 TaxID=3041166 RepID=UPI002540488A|nr:iron-containing redox enzyme family protein [Nocardioides sp. T2.26MG-1]